MSRSTVNFWLDAAIGLILTAHLAISGVVSVVFPPALEAHGWTLWGYDYNQWCNARDIILLVFALGVLVHLILHWNWICGYITNQIAKRRGERFRLEDGEKTLIGVGTLVVVLTAITVVIGAAEFGIREPRPDAEQTTVSLTLRDS
ncbi:MAG: DUF4405 domain-containing protein [Phycisphaerae bacterium]